MGRQGRKPRLRLVPGGKGTSVDLDLSKVPAHLPRAGKDLWKGQGPKLQKLGLLKEKDAPAFYMLCLSWGLACDAAATVEREGHTVAGTHGTVKKHPALTILNEQLSHYRQYLSEFGMSPTSFQRLGLGAQGAEDDMEILLRGR